MKINTAEMLGILVVLCFFFYAFAKFSDYLRTMLAARIEKVRGARQEIEQVREEQAQMQQEIEQKGASSGGTGG